MTEQLAAPAQQFVDVSGEYMSSREERVHAQGAGEMTEWLGKQPQPQAVKDPAAGIEARDIGEVDDPFPTDRPAPAEQSTMGKVLRSAGEVPKGMLLGVDRAVRHATDWAVKPLVDWLNTNVANLEVPVANVETTTGKITQSLTEFLTGFVPALRGMRALGMTGKIAAPLAASAIADFAVRDPHEARLSNLWQEMKLPKNVLTDYLAADPKDSAVEGRLKSAAESVLTGGALEGLLHGARMLRAAKGVSKAQGDELSAFREQYGELDEKTFNKALGDPTQPMLTTVVEPVPLAVGKVREGLEATEELANAAGGGAAPLRATPRTADPVAAKARIEELKAETKTLAEKGDLTKAEADRFQSLMAEMHGHRFEVVKPVTPDKIKPVMSTLSPEATAAAYNDTIQNKEVFSAVASASDGVRFNADTAIDAIMEGKGSVTAGQLYHAYDNTRAAIRAQFGDTITLYRAVGEQKTKATSNWATTEEFAKQFGDKVIKKEFPVEDIIAVNVTRNGKYHELVMGKAPDIASATPLKASGIPVEQVAEGLKVNWARVDVAQDVQVLMGDMAGRFKDHIDEARRGIITHEATTKLADDLGMTVAQLLERRKGQPLNAEEALSARRLWAASGERLLETAQTAAGANAGALDQFAFRKALATHYAIQAEVIGARTETARALNAWRIPAGGGVERARAIQQTLEAMGGKLESQEIARRLAILAKHGNPNALAKFAERGAFAKSFDVVREVWVNGLLSSPQTHFVNTLSNTAVMFSQALERGVAARIGQLRGSQGEVVAPGEALAMLYGQISAIKDAWSMASKAFKSGETGWALNKVELPHPRATSSEAWGLADDTALGRTVDFLGTTARVPSRFLGAEDEFFKTMVYRGELHAQALRQATTEGLSGEAFGRRIAELVTNTPENLRIASADAALYATFTNQTGAIGQAFMKLRERVPAVTFVLPFIRTPMNIARYTFERSPFAPLVGQWRDDIAAGGARADIALARMATGSTIMLSALDWADSGLIVGELPKDPGERESITRQGGQSNSIKLGDKWYSFNRTDPFGALLGFASNISTIARRSEMNEDDLNEWQELAAAGIAAVAQVAVNKTYLRGLSDVFEVMADPTRYGEGYINNLVASFLPYTALAGGVARLNDPVQRETTNPWEALQTKMIGLSDKLPPRLTLWGDEIRMESGHGKAYDFFSPIQARTVKPEPIDTEILRLAPLAAMDNVEGSAPRRIGKRTSIMGVQVNFKEWKDAYVDYVKLAGNELKHPAWGLGARDFLNAVVQGKHELSTVYNVDKSDEAKIRFINTAVGQYRALAQQALLADPKHARFAEYVQQVKADKEAAMLPPSAR